MSQDQRPRWPLLTNISILAVLLLVAYCGHRAIAISGHLDQTYAFLAVCGLLGANLMAHYR